MNASDEMQEAMKRISKQANELAKKDVAKKEHRAASGPHSCMRENPKLKPNHNADKIQAYALKTRNIQKLLKSTSSLPSMHSANS